MILPLPQEQHETVNQEKGIKYQGRLRMYPGLKAWWFDPITGDIQEIKPQGKAVANMNGNAVTNAQAMVPDNTVIFHAINLKNARRKADKYLNSLKQ